MKGNQYNNKQVNSHWAMGEGEQEGKIAIRKMLHHANLLIDRMLEYPRSIPIIYKKTCMLLISLIRQCTRPSTIDPAVRQSMEASFKKIQALADLQQHWKYGDQFSLFAYAVAKYQYKFGTKFNMLAHVLPVDHGQNTEEQKYHSQPVAPISSRDLKFLRSSRINQFFGQLANNQMVLQNPQCICCAKVFIRDLPIYNANPYFSTVLEIGSRNHFERITLERYINTACNSGGGVILIGAERREGNFCATGIKYKNAQEVAYRQAEIEAALQMIKPPCIYEIKKVIVHTNYAEMENVADQYLRICFRILAYPRLGMLHYLQYSAKGYQNVYEIYTNKNGDQQPYNMHITEQMYEKMHEKYRNPRQKRNSHENISCVRPCPQYSHVFKAYYRQGRIRAEDLENPKPSQDEQQQQKQKKPGDDPIFTYQHTSLLTVVSKKYDRYIQDFVRALSTNKEEVSLSKPFTDSFANCSRSIWMLSHRKTTQEIKEQLASLESMGVIQADIINVFPVHRMLQLQRHKLSEFNEKMLERRFKQRYAEMYRVENATVMEKGKQKNILYLIFNDFSQAIYAYLIFEELQIRPFFVRENSLNKGKAKKVQTQVIS